MSDAARKKAIGLITGGRVDMLEAAGLVIVNRFYYDSLEAENDRLKDVLAAAEQREAVCREALKSIEWEAKQDENYAILSITGPILAQPSPGAEKWQALVEAVRAALSLLQYEKKIPDDLYSIRARNVVRLEQALGAWEGGSSDV